MLIRTRKGKVPPMADAARSAHADVNWGEQGDERSRRRNTPESKSSHKRAAWT